MFKFQTPKSLDCPEIGLRVRVDQTEGQCRTSHGCEQEYCPLNGEFREDKLDFLLRTQPL